METPSTASTAWDVVVLGGALSGASTAWLLLRRNPRLRVLILERSDQFKRRVGESTVEVSSYFLGRVLDLNEHLHEKHITKQGLRFWFQNEHTHTLDSCSETGPGYNVRLPGYQVDRAVLDEELLARTVAAGAKLLRPVRITDVTLVAGGQQTISWSSEDGRTGVEFARWVVDASGVAAVLARKNGWLVPNTDHPIASAWSRWTGVKNWDSRELADKFPEWSRRTKGWRNNATNHLVGRGWWAWMIPLKGGDVSVGVVFDQRITDLPAGESIGSRLRSMLMEHPAGAELLANASWQEGDVHFRRNLAYRSTTFAGDGFVLVGDAAGFIDPFYSPGMDWIGYTACSAATLVDGSIRGKPKAPRIARHNELFTTSYDRWFRAIYQDKYYYMGDHELMTLAFRLDLGLYYFGVVSQPFKHGAAAFETPAFAGPHTRLPFRLISGYHRRLVSIARSRLARGVWGRNNHQHYFGFRSYELTWTLPFRLIGVVGVYARLELCEGWRTWFVTPVAPAESSCNSLKSTGSKESIATL
ncbi:NAD(P)/FAD-dependent oxidoreductase [Rariglobus hedericola]|uniref:NAD(P)/FAD-dependent oxidoreductase n=1 Tax=Rariglobus hedericola TaxID=2597822 RepID=A0A556QN99_9BACT|nr:tryptophan 7-halogenase [Rariglobus hedericola]TSJ78113.1 NAD(P)/FAD-dependent oxidoreductase [Rariglobus hedericola]